MIETVDDHNESTSSGSIGIESPLFKSNNDIPSVQDRLGFLHWRVGRSSMTLGIDFESDRVPCDSNKSPKKTVRFSGGSSGRHYARSPLLWADSHPDVRLVLIDGTTEPLSFYGLNLDITRKHR